MDELASIRAIVLGRVQGVNFRAFTVREAAGLGLNGYARNAADSSVEVVAEGQKSQLQKLVDRLKVGPSRAVVEKVEVTWLPFTGAYQEFRVKY